MRKSVSVVLILVGVALNNIVYLQDLWFGQAAITLDGWRATAGIIVSIAIVLIGLVGLLRPSR